MRVDIMSKMRGVDSFDKLWRRRTVIELTDKTICDLVSLPDLVQAKKTQRDKDWPVIRRLIEANYFQHFDKPNITQIKFWLLELRTPELLIELALKRLSIALRLQRKRPLLEYAVSNEPALLESALRAEESAERTKDRIYWLPLLKELEKLRYQNVKNRQSRKD